MTARHTFVVPVFENPQWLDRCLRSLRAQTIRSVIRITTSTPSVELSRLAASHGIPVLENPVHAGIGADWNFALRQVTTDWVSLAHQDDEYASDYVARCLAAADTASDVTLVFTAANELYEDDTPSLNSTLKRTICRLAFPAGNTIQSRFRKRLLLSFGNPIPCPSVMLHKSAIPDFQFEEDWKSNLDWIAWIRLADRPGTFVYVADALVKRRVHADAATARWMTERAIEDDRVLRELWPLPISWLLSRVCALGRYQYRSLSGKGTHSDSWRSTQ